MKKSMKVFLGIAGVAALIGICFACLSVYAKKEINKPKFELPEIAGEQAQSPLPTTKEDAFDYVNGLYGDCLAADDIETSQHTDVHLTDGEKVTPFSEDDNEVLSRVLENSQGNISALYPAEENVLITKSEYVPSLGFTKADVTDFTAVKGYVNEDGEKIDDGFYYVTLSVKPDVIDTKAMAEGEITQKIKKELEPMLTASALNITAEEFTASFKINYYNDMLTWVELKQKVKVKSAVDFTDEYKALSDKTAEFEIPFEKVTTVDLFHYGLHFTERQMAVQKSDMKALPLEVRVNSETTKDDYSIKFTVSEDGILDIDADGVMTVTGTKEEPVTVTATLEYDGHTYTDTLTVYATELEVKTDEP